MEKSNFPNFGVPVHLENVEFVQPCPVQFRCRKCSSVDAALHRAKCGHGFCGRCVNSARAARFQCPVDSRPVEKKELVPDKEITDNLLQLNVYCLQRERGCKRSVVFKDLEGHLETCGYVAVACPCNCGLQVSKRDLAHHLTTTCERRLVTCNFCQEEVVYKHVQEHHGVCKKRPITCPHCKEEVRREQTKDFPKNDSVVLVTTITVPQKPSGGIYPGIPHRLPNHEISCPMKPRMCRLANAGCSFKGTVEELEKHEENLQSHIVVMAKVIEDCQLHIKELEKKIEDTSEENRKLHDQFQDMYPIFASVKNCEKTIANMQEKIKKLEIAEQTVEEMNETLHRLKEHMQRMQPAVVQDHKSKSPSEVKSPEPKSPPKGLFSHNNSFEERHKHAAPPTDL